MFCYYCGAQLDSTDSCPNCEVDVRMIKKIQGVSNYWYNEGLARVKVRDLSGGADALKKSLKWNKMNVDARNLLGLVYYEMGEAVDAVSEWVISKSLVPEDNLASEYLNKVQNSGTRIDHLNQTSKKFNQALTYCQQGNDDLAIIQLKKVLSMNNKLVKGHQLLALLYMKNGRYDLAKKALKNAGRIDANNVRTLTYLRECNDYLKAHGKNKREKDDNEIISYESGNDLIIRPRRFIDNTMVMSVINLLIGAAIGVAVVCFLIVPGIKQNAQNQANMSVVKANETISTKDQDIKDLEAQIEALNAQVTTAQTDSQTAADTVVAYESMLDAYVLFATENYSQAADALSKVPKDKLDSEAQGYYNTVEAGVQAELIGKKYNAAIDAYGEKDYQTAVNNLTEVVAAEEGYRDGQAMYYLAHSYYRLKDGTNAIKWFEKCAASDYEFEMSKDDIEDYIKSIKNNPNTYGLNNQAQDDANQTGGDVPGGSGADGDAAE